MTFVWYYLFITRQWHTGADTILAQIPTSSGMQRLGGVPEPTPVQLSPICMPVAPSSPLSAALQGRNGGSCLFLMGERRKMRNRSGCMSGAAVAGRGEKDRVAQVQQWHPVVPSRAKRDSCCHGHPPPSPPSLLFLCLLFCPQPKSGPRTPNAAATAVGGGCLSSPHLGLPLPVHVGCLPFSPLPATAAANAQQKEHVEKEHVE